ncbi:hypothetical protein D1872_251290 [compost metagenome]
MIQTIEVTSYVPELLLRKWNAPEWDRLSPVEDVHSGAVLFVDISGFTLLSQKLAHQGTIGLEQVTGILNACFDTMIDRISRAGGKVVSFAGDALLATWSEGSWQAGIASTGDHGRRKPVAAGLCRRRRLHRQLCRRHGRTLGARAARRRDPAVKGIRGLRGSRQGSAVSAGFCANRSVCGRLGDSAGERGGVYLFLAAGGLSVVPRNFSGRRRSAIRTGPLDAPISSPRPVGFRSGRGS